MTLFILLINFGLVIYIAPPSAGCLKYCDCISMSVSLRLVCAYLYFLIVDVSREFVIYQFNLILTQDFSRMTYTDSQMMCRSLLVNLIQTRILPCESEVENFKQRSRIAFVQSGLVTSTLNNIR